MSVIDDAIMAVSPESFATVAAVQRGRNESDRRSHHRPQHREFIGAAKFIGNAAADEANDVTDRTPLLDRQQVADEEQQNNAIDHVDCVLDQTVSG